MPNLRDLFAEPAAYEPSKFAVLTAPSSDDESTSSVAACEPDDVPDLEEDARALALAARERERERSRQRLKTRNRTMHLVAEAYVPASVAPRKTPAPPQNASDPGGRVG